MSQTVEFNIDTEIVTEERSEEQFGSWFVECRNTLESVSLLGEESQNYGCVPYEENEPLKRGDSVYAVWVEYSTGDSFGHGVRDCVEPICVTRDADSAFALKSYIEEHYALHKSSEGLRDKAKMEAAMSHLEQVEFKSEVSYRSDYVISLRMSKTGQIIYIGYVPWCGYFESLDKVNVERVMIR